MLIFEIGGGVLQTMKTEGMSNQINATNNDIISNKLPSSVPFSLSPMCILL